jgi:RND family efflux transporter MFP subunit
MKSKKTISITIILLLGISGFFLYQKNLHSEDIKRTYSAYKVEKTDFEKIVEADGVMEARDTKLVYADKSLKVDKVYYDEGDYVKKEDVIMTFDPEDKNAVIRELKKEEINLKKLKRNLKNAEELLKIGGSSKIEVENLEFDIETSLLEIEEYKEELSKILDEIKSPFDGTIISMVAEENYRVNTEVELFEIADLSDIIVVAEVPEYSINGVELGQNVRISPESYNEVFNGTISKISTLSTATSSDGESSDDTEAYVEVEITMENVPEQLRPGFNVDIEIITSVNKDSIAVPRTSVLQETNKYYVFQLNSDSTITKKYIKIKMNNSNVLLVEGLDNNIKILRDPDQILTEGTVVKIGTDENKLKEKKRD